MAITRAEVKATWEQLIFLPAIIRLAKIYASGLTGQPVDPQPYFERGLSLLQTDSPTSLAYGQALREYGSYLYRQGERQQGNNYLQKARDVFERLGAKGELAKVKRLWVFEW